MIYYPPQNIAKRGNGTPSIFLAGTIDMGNSENWQKEMGEFMSGYGYDVFNPRREDWDSSWEQNHSNAQFVQQVKWEINALNHAEMVLFNFLPGSQSPVTMLELGLYSKYPYNKNVHIVCPSGFWRSGNVEIVCELYDLPLYDSLEDFKNYIKTR